MIIFNTLSRQKEEFTPLNVDQVKLYACGPTVYDLAHIGHFRAYIFVDLLRRALKYNGFTVRHVMNITDVGHLTDDADSGEDKMEKRAIEVKKTVWDIAKFYTDDFFAVMGQLNVEKPDIVCKATDHISEMIELIRQIEQNGYVYKTSDGIYFDTSKLSDYGKLARLNIKELKEGARVEVNPEKKNPTDFALWKFTPPAVKRQMEWDSPWGKGFPGWHIECTAMAHKYLGTDIDIHTGGIDHIPVHHTNEIAQAQGAFGRDIVRFWLHNEFVLVDGEKMSKSKKNFYAMADIIKQGIDPLAVRYFFLQAHYRTPVNFTWHALQASQNGLDNLQVLIQNSKFKIQNENSKFKIDDNDQYYNSFKDAINDDLNTAKGLAILWELLQDSQMSDKNKLALALDFDRVLGLGFADVKRSKKIKIPLEIKKLARERETARQNKDFALADELRGKIEEAGFVIEDTAQGTRILRKND
ncbi:MAG: cysteine--tRNA ligase [Patescibacteria group bacterium]